MNESASTSCFGKASRLLSSSQFRHVFDQKQSVADRVLVAYGALNDCGQSRLGLAVSRKVGNAVVRNRWKRQIREAFRCHQAELPQNLDLVLLPRRGIAPDHDAIRRSLVELTHRLDRRLNRTGRS